MPKVTIVIPTFNSEKFIAQAIESVLNQTYQDFELIISDDNSNDKTDEIVSFYVENDQRIHYFKNSIRLGLYNNYNKCIEYSSGKYINILGHDDVMLPRNVEVKIDIFEQYPNVGLVSSSIEVINAHNEPINFWNWGQNNSNSLEIGKDWVVNKVTPYNPLCCPFVFLRSSVIEKSGLFSSQYPLVGDFDMWLRVALCCDVYLIQEVLGKYRWHETNESNKYDALYYLTEVSQLWNNIIDKLNLPSTELRQMEDRILTGLFDYFIRNFIEHNIEYNLDYTLKMIQVLDLWRQKERKMSTTVMILNKYINELNTKISQIHTQFEQTKAELGRAKIEELSTQITSLELQLQETCQEARKARERITAMETSKFWRLRKVWFSVKRNVGLPTNE